MKRPLKYRNTPVKVDGVKYASKAEARRGAELKLLERSGKISHLRTQPKFPIEINGVVICRYVGDYAYLENGAEVVEDVKSPATRKNPVYVLKKKLVAAVLGITIREIG
jgi:hypothetical protein